MADKCLNAVWTLFKKKGGTLFDNCAVSQVIPFGNEVQVNLSSGKTLTSKRVVICAGPWTNRLTESLGYTIFQCFIFNFMLFFILYRWKLPLNPIKIPVFYYKAKGHIPHTFIYDDLDSKTHIWGLPELEYPGLVKVTF